MADLKITEEIRSIINQCRFDGLKVYLPNIQLDRKLYTQVNTLFAELKGVWNRKEKAHIFPEDPREKLGVLVAQDKLIDQQKFYQKFYTPQWLVEKLVTLADVKGKTVLEPSCGDGRIIDECKKQGSLAVQGIDITDIDLKNREDFKRGEIVIQDFLEYEFDDIFYDLALGNPPFHKNFWLKHTLHAYKFVKPGGKLVFILPNSIHSNKKFQDFVLDKKWEFEIVEAGAFKEEGTLIETNIVTIWK